MLKSPELHVVLWGATGAVGRRVAHHLAARIGNRDDIRGAIGGRNRAKLEDIRSKLGAAAKDLPIIVADSHDLVAMEAMAARTAVVSSTVGPFALYGSELVDACARSGTHYCDLTAETHWMRKMIDAHLREAEQPGARIVHACGHDSIPSDIGVFFLQRAAQQMFSKPLSQVRLRIVKFSGVSAVALRPAFFTPWGKARKTLTWRAT